ncbi:RHS repeat-associated core domain-containing protein [Pseudomonas sp. NPDC007930]|uniref:RHS repeat-associated core domain-containing protein n=1 Tax=Pseudomonas sp. NPDC007930 TaxID=3364417 RepID=UPI0036EDF7FB
MPRASLLACDSATTALARQAGGRTLITHSPFGTRRPLAEVPHSGFTGVLLEPDKQGYLLGNGYRYYSPTLRRFHQPDRFSPFAAGGCNAYAYCSADPVNRVDRNGAWAWALVEAFAGLSLAAGTMLDTASGILRHSMPGAAAKVSPWGRLTTSMFFWSGTLSFTAAIAMAPLQLSEDLPSVLLYTAVAMGAIGGGIAGVRGAHGIRKVHRQWAFSKRELLGATFLEATGVNLLRRAPFPKIAATERYPLFVRGGPYRQPIRTPPAQLRETTV